MTSGLRCIRGNPEDAFTVARGIPLCLFAASSVPPKGGERERGAGMTPTPRLPPQL